MVLGGLVVFKAQGSTGHRNRAVRMVRGHHKSSGVRIKVKIRVLMVEMVFMLSGRFPKSIFVSHTIIIYQAIIISSFLVMIAR